MAVIDYVEAHISEEMVYRWPLGLAWLGMVQLYADRIAGCPVQIDLVRAEPEPCGWRLLFAVAKRR